MYDNKATLYHNPFSTLMARKSLKSPPTVEPNQFGCAWSFSGMFDDHHHHCRPHRKMLSNESHGSKNLQGAGPARSQSRMLTFDEQLKNINIESKKKTANVNQLLEEETSSSNHTRKNNEIWKNNIEISVWKKIKARYESQNKKKENTGFVDRIVVLKPNRYIVEFPVDVGCRCLYLHHQQSSIRISKPQLIKHTHVSLNDVRKRLKNAKKMKNSRKMKSCDTSEGSEIDGNDSKIEKLSIAPFSKKREAEVFIEAKRHLAERLRQVGNGAGEPSGSSCKRASRTLERILLSSPVHESMATYCRKLEGLNPKNMLDSDQKNIGSMGLDGCFEGSQMEISLDVSSPKANCELENIDNDQFRENPSPVSVLDSFFTDNISSPTSTIESVELQVQPHRLDFEEHSSRTSSPQRKTNLSSFMDDREFISSYVSDMYQLSQSNWEDFIATDCPMESSCDHKLLHDCVKEVLVTLHSRITTFFSSKIQPFSLEKDVVNKVIDQVDWHNGQPIGPRTLDLLVRRDIAKNGKWLDVISDINDIVFEVVDETIQELIMEAIFNMHV